MAQILLQRDTDFSILLELLKGERVKVDGALKKIGWPSSQSDIYARLSLWAHPTRTQAFLGRTVDFESEPLKSFIREKELSAIANIMLWQAAPENEEARQDRWVLIALNTFDLAVSSLFTLYGAGAPESGWWGQRKRLLMFEAVAERNRSMQQELLWFKLRWPHSKQSDMERDLDLLLNSE